MLETHASPARSRVLARERHAHVLVRGLLSTALALAAAGARAGVAQGPMVQAVTHDQAGVWVRTTTDQPVRVRYTGPDGVALTTAPVMTSHALSDDTASFMLTSLVAGSIYTYQVGTTDPGTGIESWSGSYVFRTVSKVVDSMSIAVLSDFANKMVASPALQQAIDHRPDLLATIGDLDHRDPADKRSGKPYPPEDAPLVLARLRKMHRDSRDPATPLGRNFFSGIVGAADTGRLQIPWVYAWDDHDFCANNQGRDCPFIAQARQAFHEYYIEAPSNSTSAGCKSEADFESLRYGTLVEVFFLDARSAQRNEADPTGKVAMLGACPARLAGEEPARIQGLVEDRDVAHAAQCDRQALGRMEPVPGRAGEAARRRRGRAQPRGRLRRHPHRRRRRRRHALRPARGDDAARRHAADLGQHLLPRPGRDADQPAGLVDDRLAARPRRRCQADELPWPRPFPDNYKVDRLVACLIYPLDGHGNPGYTWIAASPAALTITVHDTAGNVKQGQRADGSLVPLTMSLVPSAHGDEAGAIFLSGAEAAGSSLIGCGGIRGDSA